jgi:hypothetical protein
LTLHTNYLLIQEGFKWQEEPMNYWEEVKRIQIKMRSVSILTAEATAIIDGITAKHGYYFRVGGIYRAVPIEEIRHMISEIKKMGGHDAEATAMEEAYKDAGNFVNGDKLEEAEIAEKKTELEQVVRQLVIEVDEYLRTYKPED